MSCTSGSTFRTFPRWLVAVGLFYCCVFAQAAEVEFEQCTRGLKDRALASGISEPTVTLAFADVQRLERVINLDRSQPEFTITFADYYSRRVTSSMIANGRDLLRQKRQLLDAVTAATGVPGHYIVAFWGLETRFGGYLGKVPVMDALVTLACDGRRTDYFGGELIAVLTLVDNGDVNTDELVGSWAGAVGQMQFMPSAYLEHAVDGDGDGARNLWRSVADAMFSAGEFLSHLGWQKGYRWGREVLLPADFEYLNGSSDESRSVSEWAGLGVMNANGEPLMQASIAGRLLLPGGRNGPVFLIYDNFDVIMGWNRAEFYALSVGLFADQIAGSPGLVRPPLQAEPLTRGTLQAVQTRLDEMGFDAGKPDGLMGPNTRRAIGQFQKRSGLIADGYPDAATLAALEISADS